VIIDSPILASLALGADRVIPEQGDNQTSIPNAILPMIQPLTGHDLSTASTDRATTSKICTNQNTYINVGTQTDNLVVLPKGLYTIQLNLAGRANFNSTVLIESLEVLLNYQGTDKNIGNLFGNTGTHNLEITRYLLLSSDAILKIRVPPTNAVATNSWAYKVAANIIRHI
jgi:hypothetical protein